VTSRLSIGARLLVGALAVLVPAAVLLGVGGWWLMRRSLFGAADSHLAAQIESTRRYIDNMEHGDHPDELEEELSEYAQLALGDVSIEVTDPGGRLLSGPLRPGWDTRELANRLRAVDLDRPVFTSERFHGAPFRVGVARVEAAGREYRVLAAVPMAPNIEALRRFRWGLYVAGPIMVVIASAGAYLIGRRALAPVDRITSGVRAITLHALDRRLDVPAADDELRRLTVTFNDMLARLEAAVADMTQFTAEAAHELRTPVTLVRTTADIALAHDRPAAEYRAALVEVQALAEHMSAVVSDLLLLARADAGVEARDTGTSDLRAIAADAAHGAAAAMAERSLQFDVDLPDRPLPMTGDAESLRRVILILLDNARKYTPVHGRVRLSLRDDPAGHRIVLTVTDSGIGIRPDERGRVFDRFYRGAAARQCAAEGSGLGLSIAQTIVHRHDGTIAIDEGPDHTGCEVTVVFDDKQARGARLDT